MTDRTERREAVVGVSEHDVFDFFAFALTASLPDAIAFPLIEGVPAGVVVVCVRHDPWHRTFYFTVGHPSFEVVPDGAVPPLLTTQLAVTHRLVELTRPEVARPATAFDRTFSPGPTAVITTPPQHPTDGR